MISKCREKAGILEEAERHFKGETVKNENLVVKLMKGVSREEELDRGEVVKCRVEVKEREILEEIRRKITLFIEISSKPPGPKLSEVRQSPPSDRRSLTKPTPTTNKRPVTRQPDSKPVQTKPKAGSTSLNSSLLGTSGVSTAIDPGKLSSKLRTTKSPFETQSRGKPGSPNSHRKSLVTDRRNSAFEIGGFLHTPEVHKTVKSDDEGSHEEEPTLRKRYTELPEGQQWPKLTDLNSARAKNRQSLLGETAKKVEDIEEKVKLMKSQAPVINVTPPYEHESLNLTTTEQLSQAIAKASEVSRTLIRTEKSRKTQSQSPKNGREVRGSQMKLKGNVSAVPVPGTKIMKIFEVNTGKVREVKNLERENFAMEAAVCVTDTNEVIITGGINGEVLKSVFIYTPASGDMESGYSMLVGRCRHSIVSVSRVIFVFGGVGVGHVAVRDCEKFDLSRKSCKRINSMPHARESHGACELNSCIYIAGGCKATDIIDKMTISTETFMSIRVQCEVVGASVVVGWNGELVVVHKNAVTRVNVGTNECGKEEMEGDIDWWTACPLLHESTLYLLKPDRLLSFSLESHQLTQLD